MKKALFIGLTTVDIQYFLDEYPQPNTKLKTNQPLVVSGGPAANAAITYTFLGGQCDFLTCIGENPFKNLLLEDFRKHHLNVIDYKNGVAFDPIVSTVLTTISNSDRTIITHHPDVLSQTSIHPIQNIEDYSFIFTDGFYPELAIPVLREAKQKGIPVIFDGGSWKPQLTEIIPLVDIAICSNNYRPPSCKSIDEAIEFTIMKGVKEVAISRGNESIVTPEKEIQIEKIDAVDSLGAGDILHGAFCWFWHQTQLNFIDALTAASKIASQSVQFKGTRSWMNKLK